MSIEGSPRPWMQDVREADWSPDGTTLAIVHSVGTKDRLEYPIGTPLYETAGYISDPRVSPDGARVAFMDHQARFDDRGWVKVVDRSGKVTTLAGEFWGEEGLAWSRDGLTVYFAANDRQPDDEAQAGDITYQVRSATLASPGTSMSVLTTPGDFNLYDIAADGRWLATREDIRLGVGARVAGETSDRDLSWLNQNWGASISRDGTRFLFSDGTAGANYSVVWRKTDGSPIVRLGEGNVLGWSPDEKWALAHTFAPVQLIVYPMGAGETVRLKRGVIAEYQTALWFPDGKSVLVVGNAAGQPTRAYRQTIPDGEPMPILADGVWPAAIAPDGQTILGVAGDGTWNWYPVDGGASKPALGVSAQDNPTGVNGWSDDGRSFFIRTGNEIPATLDRVDVATGRRTTLRQIGPPDRAGVFTLSVTTVTHDGAQYAYRYQKRLSTMFVVTGGR
jgi:Tol biopolymer transport system component